MRSRASVRPPQNNIRNGIQTAILNALDKDRRKTMTVDRVSLTIHQPDFPTPTAGSATTTGNRARTPCQQPARCRMSSTVDRRPWQPHRFRPRGGTTPAPSYQHRSRAECSTGQTAAHVSNSQRAIEQAETTGTPALFPNHDSPVVREVSTTEVGRISINYPTWLDCTSNRFLYQRDHNL